jgi:hypothetical protein
LEEERGLAKKNFARISDNWKFDAEIAAIAA